MRCGVPELPEVETVRRGLAPAMEGERFKAVELAVGQMVGAQWDVPTIFAVAGGSVLIGAAASALMGLLPRVSTSSATLAAPTSPSLRA